MAQAEWLGFLNANVTASIEDVRSMASEVAQRALKDISMTVEQQATRWGTTAARMLQKPIPCDTTSIGNEGAAV